MNFRDSYVGVLSFIGSIVLILSIRDASYKTKVFPLACIAALLIFSLVMIFSKKGKVYELKNFRQFMGSLVLVTLYVVFLKRIGFLVSTTLFMLSFITYNKFQASRMVIVAYSVGYSLVVYFVFKVVLNVFLPTGILI